MGGGLCGCEGRSLNCRDSPQILETSNLSRETDLLPRASYIEPCSAPSMSWYVHLVSEASTQDHPGRHTSSMSNGIKSGLTPTKEPTQPRRWDMRSILSQDRATRPHVPTACWCICDGLPLFSKRGVKERSISRNLRIFFLLLVLSCFNFLSRAALGSRFLGTRQEYIPPWACLPVSPLSPPFFFLRIMAVCPGARCAKYFRPVRSQGRCQENPVNISPLFFPPRPMDHFTQTQIFRYLSQVQS